MTRHRRQRPTPPPEAPPADSPSGDFAPVTLTVSEIRDLGRELIGELAPNAGDAAAVRATLLQWLDREELQRFSLVAMSAVQTVFSTCLARTPTGAWTLNPPPDERTAS